MSFEFTIDGLSIETFEEIFNAAAEKYKDIYGQDINIDQNAPDGQRLAISTKAAIDVQEVVQQIYNGLDVDLASGVFLDIIAKIAGLTRRPATRSSVEVDIVTTADITLPSSYIVADENGQNWQTIEEVDLTTGTNSVTLYAEFYGAYEASANTVNEPVTIILGVESINNPLAAVAGDAYETDEEFRQRRDRGVENPALSIVGALLSALLDTEDVTDAQVYENKLSTYDFVRDMVAHSIWVIVEGGSIADIAETMAKNKTMGATEKGDITGNYDEIITANGTDYIYRNLMKFQRPTLKDLYVSVNATATTGTLDPEGIKNAIAEKTYLIGENAVSSGLYAFAYQANTNYVLSDLEISDDNITYIDGLLEPGLDGMWMIDTANITITEI